MCLLTELPTYNSCSAATSCGVNTNVILCQNVWLSSIGVRKFQLIRVKLYLVIIVIRLNNVCCQLVNVWLIICLAVSVVTYILIYPHLSG